MRAATEGSLPPVMPQGDLVEVLGREVRQGSPGELMVESTPSCQRRPPCKTNKEESDEAADAAALTYLLTYWCESSASASLDGSGSSPSGSTAGLVSNWGAGSASRSTSGPFTTECPLQIDTYRPSYGWVHTP